MSRLMINKFMRAVEMSDAAVEAYVADPRAFVDHWLATSAPPSEPSDDRALTDEEEAAVLTRDYGELYRLGAHPYLLWHFAEAIWGNEVPWPELNERYRAAVAPHGYPDFVV